MLILGVTPGSCPGRIPIHRDDSVGEVPGVHAIPTCPDVDASASSECAKPIVASRYSIDQPWETHDVGGANMLSSTITLRQDKRQPPFDESMIVNNRTIANNLCSANRDTCFA